MDDDHPLRCTLCQRRPVCDALELWEPRVGGGRGVWHAVLGCLPCLRRAAWRNAGRLARHLRLWSALRQLSLAAALPWITPTAWFARALLLDGLTTSEFLARQAGRLHAIHVGDPEARVASSRDLIVLLRAVAAADGETTAAEWRTLRRQLYVMHLEEPVLWTALGVPEQPVPAPDAAEIEAAIGRLRPRLRRLDQSLLLQLFAEIIASCGGIDAREQERARRLSTSLGIEAELIRESFGAARPRRGAAEILGVGEDASLAEIRRAYLRLAMDHHPDRAARLGPALAHAANERMKEINLAYQELRASRSG